MNPPTRTRKAASGHTTNQQSASCRGCSARWTGTAACHCGACHHTFTGVSAFDAHRRRGECLPPDAAGLVLNERGRWGGEPMSDQARAAFAS